MEYWKRPAPSSLICSEKQQPPVPNKDTRLNKIAINFRKQPTHQKKQENPLHEDFVTIYCYICLTKTQCSTIKINYRKFETSVSFEIMFTYISN